MGVFFLCLLGWIVEVKYIYFIDIKELNGENDEFLN